MNNELLSNIDETLKKIEEKLGNIQKNNNKNFLEKYSIFLLIVFTLFNTAYMTLSLFIILKNENKIINTFGMFIIGLGIGIIIFSIKEIYIEVKKNNNK